MKIFILWIGFVCCSIANGIIYDHVDESVRLSYMMIPSCIALVLLIAHCIYTKNWVKPTGEKQFSHPTVFTISTGIAFFVGVITLLSVKTNDASWGTAIGVCSAFVCFLFAALRERSYTKIF